VISELAQSPTVKAHEDQDSIPSGRTQVSDRLCFKVFSSRARLLQALRSQHSNSMLGSCSLSLAPFAYSHITTRASSCALAGSPSKSSKPSTSRSKTTSSLRYHSSFSGHICQIRDSQQRDDGRRDENVESKKNSRSTADRMVCAFSLPFS
ncbi:hypothetical protein C8R45DRAFT_1047673, partial [Mycena sanguinolenta]